MNIFTTIENNETNINELIIHLIKHYPLFIQEPERLKEIINHFKLDNSNLITLVIENDYVDRQYRDSYYSYFSQKHSNFERNCLRLVFFEGDVKYTDFMSDLSRIKEKLIGTIVMRPLNVGNIGYTLLNPKKLDIDGYIQTCSFKLMVCGRKFVIKAFPYLSQDNETMTCAETALYNLIQYYSEKYCEYRILMPSEILKTLEDSSYERVLPSHGVDDIFMAKVLQSGHFYPRLYHYDIEEGQCFEEIFYAYVESGIPFIFGLPQHAVICIGHGMVDYKIENHNLDDIVKSEDVETKTIYSMCTAQLIDNYIFMDDNQMPYVVSTIDALTTLYSDNIDLSVEYDADELEDEIFDRKDSTDIVDNKNSGESLYTEDAVQKMKKRFDSLLVPLYKRIFLDASRAKSIFDEHFLQNPDFIQKIQNEYNDATWGYDKKNPLVWRMYLASSNSYKDYKCKTATNEKIYEYYSTQPYPRFIWVLEISTITEFAKKKARVEILLDATSSRNSDTWALLSISYKRHLVFVPYVIDSLQKDQNVKKHLSSVYIDDDYSSVDWNNINENVKKRPLTEIFKSLYYKVNDFVADTFDIFVDSNLKEI